MGLPGQLTIIHKGSGMQVVSFHGHANICLEDQSYKDQLLTQGLGQYEGKMGVFGYSELFCCIYSICVKEGA